MSRHTKHFRGWKVKYCSGSGHELLFLHKSGAGSFSCGQCVNAGSKKTQTSDVVKLTVERIKVSTWNLAEIQYLSMLYRYTASWTNKHVFPILCYAIHLNKHTCNFFDVLLCSLVSINIHRCRIHITYWICQFGKL